MSPRLAGAALALFAAVLLAGSVVGVPWAWWDGHPEVKGETIRRKLVHVGPLGGTGCNTGLEDEGAPPRPCEHLSLNTGFTVIGYLEALVCGLLAAASALLAVFGFRDDPRRRQLARVVIGGAAGASALAIVLLIVGPHVTAAQVAIPLGPGIGVFWVAIVGSVLASVLARKPEGSRAPRAPRTSIPSLPAMYPSPSPPVDLAALLQQDQLRPTSLGPEPMIGRPPPSPGGMLPGPAGPLGVPQPTRPSAPLFSSAPQLRPLYDASPAQGGTAGFVPTAAPPLPTRVPTPIVRADLAHLAGLAPPPGFEPPERPSAPPTKPFERPDSPRPRPASVAPPRPPRNNPASMPPPVRPIAPPKPTITSAVVPPPPAAPKPPAVSAPIVPAMLPIRAATDPEDLIETVGFDPVEPRDTAAGLAAAEPDAEVGDQTDASVPVDPRAATGSELAETTSHERVSASVIPVTTASSSLPPPAADAAISSGPSPACPQCEAPMAWVDEHLRFYCKSCRMYF